MLDVFKFNISIDRQMACPGTPILKKGAIGSIGLDWMAVLEKAPGNLITLLAFLDEIDFNLITDPVLK